MKKPQFNSADEPQTQPETDQISEDAASYPSNRDLLKKLEELGYIDGGLDI